ncbi:MAG: hypothetical protein V4722_10665 [Bacteroidota bacterium]
MKQFVVAVIVGASLFTMSCKPSKDQMKKEFISSCIEQASKTMTNNDEKTTRAVADYCECTGQKLIDQFSVEELEKLTKDPNDAELTKKLKPIINTCTEALGKALGQ